MVRSPLECGPGCRHEAGSGCLMGSDVGLLSEETSRNMLMRYPKLLLVLSTVLVGLYLVYRDRDLDKVKTGPESLEDPNQAKLAQQLVSLGGTVDIWPSP